MHITDKKICQPWRAGQVVMRELYKYLGSDFKWKKPPYEYNYTHMPIDIINGTDKLRLWVENNGDMTVLDAFEDFYTYKNQLARVILYS